MVLHENRYSTISGAQVHGDGLAVAVLDGVHDEVAQDTFDAPFVDVRLDPARGDDLDGRAPSVRQRHGRSDNIGDSAAQVHRREIEGRGAGVEPADLEQVGQERLEAVELTVEELDGAPSDRLRKGAAAKPI